MGIWLPLATTIFSPQADERIGLGLVLLLLLCPPVLLLAAWKDRRLARREGRARRWKLQLSARIAFYGALLLLIYAVLIEPALLTTTRIDVALPQVPAGRELRIVHLSDLHITGHTRLHDRIVERVAAEAPALIVLTGDQLHYPRRGGHRDVAVDLFNRLSDIAPVVMIVGNHDALPPPTLLRWVLLRNEYLDINLRGVPLRITGWEQKYRIWRPPTLGTDPHRVNLLLVHSPDKFDEAAAQGMDLALAGHTHGGQVRLPFWGAIVTSSEFGKRFEYGRYRIGHLQAFVTRGLGQNPWPAPPLRFLCPPEIVSITLRHGK